MTLATPAHFERMRILTSILIFHHAKSPVKVKHTTVDRNQIQEAYSSELA